MTQTQFKLWVLLPAYNEEKALAELIPTIGRMMRDTGVTFEICVVNDGSKDGTQKLLAKLSQEWPIRELAHEKNKGYGAALNTGFSWIAKHALPTDIALSLDADNTHSPVYFAAMIEQIQNGFDVVTTSYTMKGGQSFGVPFKRQILSRGANLLFRLCCPLPGTRMYTNGFRAYRVAALQRALQKYGEHLIEESGFPGGTELLLKVVQFGVKTTEVPFVLRYDRRGSQSKIRIMRTIGSYLKLMRFGVKQLRQ